MGREEEKHRNAKARYQLFEICTGLGLNNQLSSNTSDKQQIWLICCIYNEITPHVMKFSDNEIEKADNQQKLTPGLKLN